VLVERGGLVIPMIQGNLAHTSGPNGPVTRIVIHATVSPCKVGGARQVAAYFQTPGAGGLAHYVVDPSEVVQCASEDVATWHAPPNRGSIGIELCDPQKGLPARWADKNHVAMLTLAAQLVADLCKRHNVPPFFVDGPGLLAGKHGITTHHEVVQAWHKSTHTDPGPGFPMGRFIDLVHAAGATPTPTPAPAAPEEDVVASLDEVRQVVQEELAKAVAKLHNDHLVLLRGTQDGTHPNNLDSIGKAVGVKQ
jgi:N-acetyl-anhydromuramyl-L-alanine amidase AmpD